MVLVSVLNPLSREITAKMVYYGPGLSGKTTTLQYVHSSVRPERRGQLVSLATETDRTIFFDFLPLHVEQVRGLGVRLQLYTVPGQVFYAATRKLVLNGADGVVFVADSQKRCADANLEALEGLRENLDELGLELEQFPLVFQYNKRDLDEVMDVAEMRGALNPHGAPDFETVASTGKGVLDALKAISRLTMRALSEHQPAIQSSLIDDDKQRVPRRGYVTAVDEGIVARVQSFAQAGRVASSAAPRKRVSSVHTPAEPARTAKEARAQEGSQVTMRPVMHAPDSPLPTPISPLPTPISPAPAPHSAPAAGNSLPYDGEEDAIIPRLSSKPAIAPPPASPPRLVATSLSLSFAPLWSDETADDVLEVERAIAELDYVGAVRRAVALLAELLEGLPGAPDVDLGTRAALLGLDGREYLRLSRLTSVPAEAVTHTDALFSLYLLVAARVKASAI
jgi:signal recognition particle receptor subunit beta